MVFRIKTVCIKMAQRFTPGRNISRIDAFRDMADDFVSRSHHFFSRSDTHHRIYRIRLQSKWTSKRARVISVILFAISVSLCAVILGLYYTYAYHPRTDRLFQRRHWDHYKSLLWSVIFPSFSIQTKSRWWNIYRIFR